MHCARIGLPTTEAEKFWSYYESKGWKVGQTPMKSWSAALVGWRSRWQEHGRVTQTANGNNIIPPWKRLQILEAEEKQLAGETHGFYDREKHPEKVARLAEVRAAIGTMRAAP